MSRIACVFLAGELLAVASTSVFADSAETRGGLKVKSDDRQFEFALNGRMHYDVYAFDADTVDATAGSFFRRARLSLSGRAYGWDFKFEEDFAGAGPAGIREMWMAVPLGAGKLHLGQMKPPRTMEELTSSNEILFMERPFASASGIYSGRQYQMGVFYLGNGERFGYGLAAYNLAEQTSAPVTEGMGATARGYVTPRFGAVTAHVGMSASHEALDDARAAGPGSVRYAGRLAPTLALGTTSATDEDATTVQAELGLGVGPVTLQGEYAHQRLGQDAASDHAVVAYYVQLGAVVSGEARAYDVKKGVFRAPRPGEAGAWELALRYDRIANDDLATSPSIENVAAAVNWYVNPNVRFMLNAALPAAESSSGGATVRDEPAVVALRAQLAF